MSAPVEMHSDQYSDEPEVPMEGSSEEPIGGSSEEPTQGSSRGPVRGQSGAGEADDWLDQARMESERKRQTRAPREIIENRGRSKISVSPDSDEALFLRYQQGDQSAFLTLYDRYKQGVFAYCAQVLMGAGLDREQAEDTFQEVFLRIAQYQNTFVGGDVKAWIFTVTRHSCLSAKKKGIRHKLNTEYVGDAENFEEDVSQEARMAMQRTDDALEKMAKSEQVDLLLKAIQQLPDTYREALLLCEYEGMTYEEVGKLTGTSLSTIRIRVFRAKARLRKMLLPIIGDDVDDLVSPAEPPPES